MAYVNERISNEDMIKYRIDETAWGYASYRNKDWIIDRDRDIYLRSAKFDRENPEREFWSFYWKGYEWPVYGYRISYESHPNPQRNKKTMKFIFTKFPVQLLEQVEKIKIDFSEAYCSYSSYITTDVTFLFEITTEAI